MEEGLLSVSGREFCSVVGIDVDYIPVLRDETGLLLVVGSC